MITCTKCKHDTPEPQVRSNGKCYHCSAPLELPPDGPRPLTDAELFALGSLLTAHAAMHSSELAFWQAANRSTDYPTPSPQFGSWAWDRIELELKRRGIAP